MKQLTPQQIFDTVARHLLTQKEKAMDDQHNCAYRGTHNRKCAAGILIKDAYYTSSLENLTTDTPAVEEVLTRSGVNMADHQIRRLVCDLQRLHDSYPPENWKARLTNYARTYSYSWPEGL
jgi:hypothetical protein